MNANGFFRRFIYALLLMPLFIWGLLNFWWGSWPSWINLTILLLYIIAHISAILFSPRRFVILFGLVAFLIPLISFFMMQPSNDRNWQADDVFMPYADINGDEIILHNVRNYNYITETDYIPHHETRQYDLSKLKSVDVMLVDWGLKYIAHTMISFGFEGDAYLCFSIETRNENGESYSAIKGFFRQYELIYIAADERDLVRLRTNIRKGENVYLYRLRVSSMDNLRGFLVDYLKRINQLYQYPKWYNAFTGNCMTSAFRLARKHAAPGQGKWHWSTILDGFADRHAYEVGSIDTSMPFDELKRKSCINQRGMAADNLPDFSRRIRKGLPGMDWVPGKGE